MAVGRPPSAGVTAAHLTSALAVERRRRKVRPQWAVGRCRPRDRPRRAEGLPLRKAGVRARRLPVVAPSFLGVRPRRRTGHLRDHCPRPHLLGLPVELALMFPWGLPLRVPARRPSAPCLRGEEAGPRPAVAEQAWKPAARLCSWAAHCRSRAPSPQGREQGYQTSANSPPTSVRRPPIERLPVRSHLCRRLRKQPERNCDPRVDQTGSRKLHPLNRHSIAHPR
jgi:hypothetical protein